MAFKDLYKRSIFFEILSLDTNGDPLKVVESMAMSIPPSSIDISQKQRITKTPTPGGFFIDNYGLGSASISISGETGNGEERLVILGPGKAQRNLTGQQVYFEFRNRIVRYSQKSENYMMKFYDLTHKGSVNIFRREGTESLGQYAEAWEVTLDDFTSRRSFQKPFFYPYSINLTGLRPIGSYNPRAARNSIGFLSQISGFLDNVTNAIDSFSTDINSFLSNNFEYVTDIVGILSTVNSLVDQVVVFSQTLEEYEKKIGGLFDSVLSETEEFLSSGIQLISFPYDVMDEGRQIVVSLREKTEALLVKANLEGKAVLDPYDWDASLDPVSNISQNMINIENPFNEVVKFAKQGASYEPIGAVSLNGIVTSVYGFTDLAIQGNTRIDKVARDIYGDPDFKDVIASLNDIYSTDELIPGDFLKLPILEPNARYATNAVYNEPSESSDILGRDIKIDNDGVFVLDPSDYSLTSKEETVLQSVFSRLAEKKGRQLRDSTYGVLTEIGQALSLEAPFELLSISLSETLIQDPRIIDVYALNFVAGGDTLYQEFKFDLINKISVNYKEGV